MRQSVFRDTCAKASHQQGTWGTAQMAENGDLCPCHKANSRTFSWGSDILNCIKLVTPVLLVSTMGWHFWVRTEAEEPHLRRVEITAFP